jgi:hypothetical protein
MNAKIERTIAEIIKTKDKIVEFQAKLRALEQQKIIQENEEIVMLFRKEKFTEDEFRAYISSRREALQGGVGGTPPASAGAVDLYNTGLPAQPGREDAGDEN